MRIGFGTEYRTLPERVVGVLDLERRPLGSAALYPARVGQQDVARQRSEGGSVGSDVVQDHRQFVLGGRHLEQRDSERRVDRDVEALGHQLVQSATELVPFDADRGDRGRCPGRVEHDLLGRSVHFRVHRAQRLVPFHDVRECGRQGTHVEWTAQMDRERQVVHRSGRIEPVEEPHALLCGREWDALGAFPGFEDRGVGSAAGSRLGPGSQCADGGGLEQLAHSQAYSECAADSCHQLCGDQRVAAELEEVLVQTDLGRAEQVLVDSGDDVFCATLRCSVLLGAGEHRLRQRFSIELSAGVERQRIEHDHCCGNHVGRQRMPGEFDGLGGVDGLPRPGDDVGDELVAGDRLHDQCHCLRDGFVCEQDGFDLAQLDALATELHLEVGASDVVQHSVAAPPNEVAGAIHPLSGVAEGVGHEPIRAQVGATHVAPRQLNAREVELARFSHRSGSQPAVQYEGAGVPLGHTDRDGSRVLWAALVVRHRDRRLGGTVEVVQSRGADGSECCRRLDRKRLADHEDMTQRSTGVGRRVGDEHGQHRGHEVGDRDAMLGDPVRHIDRVAVPVGGGEHHRRAHSQRQEETPQRDVERRRRLLQIDIGGIHRILRQHPLHLIVDGGVLHGDALRAAGGAGGVDDVRGVRNTKRRNPFRVADRSGRPGGQVDQIDGDRLGALGQRHVVTRRDQYAPRLRGIEDVGRAFGRMIRVDRYPRSACRHDGVHADHEIERASNGQSDESLRADAHVDQMASEAVHPRRQFSVSQDVALVHQSRGVGTSGRGSLEGGEQSAGRRLVFGVVPLGDDQCALGSVGQSQVPDEVRRGCCHETAEEVDEPLVIAAGLIGAVQVGVGLEVDVGRGPGDARVEVQSEVLDEAGGEDVDPADHRSQAHLAEEQHDVDPGTEERSLTACAAGVAANVLVPVPLVAQCTGDLGVDARQHRFDGGVARDVEPQRHHVGHHAAGAAQNRGGSRGHRQ
nr:MULTISPECIES: hypothetical protein [unclassified Rhodococcus (in: high G+C Gram-positive bacteria)]